MSSWRNNKRKKNRARATAAQISSPEEVQSTQPQDLGVREAVSEVEAVRVQSPPEPDPEPEEEPISESFGWEEEDKQNPGTVPKPSVVVTLEHPEVQWKTVSRYHRVILRKSARMLVLVYDQRWDGDLSLPSSSGNTLLMMVSTIPDTVFEVETLTYFDDGPNLYLVFKILQQAEDLPEVDSPLGFVQ